MIYKWRTQTCRVHYINDRCQTHWAHSSSFLRQELFPGQPAPVHASTLLFNTSRGFYTYRSKPQFALSESMSREHVSKIYSSSKYCLMSAVRLWHYSLCSFFFSSELCGRDPGTLPLHRRLPIRGPADIVSFISIAVHRL